MRFSIVINTLNRGQFLKRLLDSFKHLDYDDFEVIVVNGPSTDNTEELIKPYMNLIKYRKCPEANLSISRNIGIKASAGDVVAFIDDDAIPDKDWLNDLRDGYISDDNVGGVGGKIYDGCRLGIFQSQYVTINKWGIAKDDYTEAQYYNDPNGEDFNIMVGCNCSFRRSVLELIEGFDEYYEYFHDESDVAVRVIRAGYKIVQHEKAYVHHSFAASGLRDISRKIKNWYPIVKNAAYFGVKNSLIKDNVSFREMANIMDEKIEVYKAKVLEGVSKSSSEYSERKETIKKAFNKGVHDGYYNERMTNKHLECDSEFKKFRKNELPNNLTICMLSKNDIFSQNGGIAKYTYELARKYADMGHNVHVITEGNDISHLTDGINIHYASSLNLSGINDTLDNNNVCKTNLEYSYGILKVFNIIDKMYNIDIIESALWDYEGLSLSQIIKNKPIVVRVETPSLMVFKTQEIKLNDDLKLNSEFEKIFMNSANGIIYISDAIKETIEKMYNISFPSNTSEKIFLGIEEYTGKKNNKKNNDIRIFFIGRLERRKGIQNIIDSMDDIFQKHQNIEFRIAGQDNIVDAKLGKTFINYFKDKYHKKPWFNKVKFLGIISNEEKEIELENCDIFISPSLYESFGLIFIEAMRHGKPVVGCNVGGMKEIIINNKTGLTVEPDRTDLFTKALIYLIENESVRKDMGEAGYNRYLQTFSSEISAKNSIEYYKKIINIFKED